MIVRVMSVFEYGDSGWDCQRRDVPSPTWAQVNEALERMDKFFRPFIWLFLRPDVDEEDVPDFDISGGSGDFMMSGPTSEGWQRRFVNRGQQGSLVVIQTSDQGGSVHPRFVCREFATVLQVTQHFCETGQFDPNVEWES